jgi:hypothetical protein
MKGLSLCLLLPPNGRCNPPTLTIAGESAGCTVGTVAALVLAGGLSR